jgi:hypothetical protein
LATEAAGAVFDRVTKGYFKTQETMQQGLIKLQQYVSQQTSDSVETQIQILERTAASAAAGGDLAYAMKIGAQIDNLKAQKKLADQALKKSQSDADAFLKNYQLPSESGGVDQEKQEAEQKAKQKADIEKEYAKKIIDDKVELLKIEKDEALKSAESVGAETANITAYYDNLIKEQEDADREEKKQKDLQAAKDTMSEISSYATLASGALAGIFAELSRQELDAIDARYQAELKANGLAEKSAVELAEEQIAAAQASGDADALIAAETALKKAQIDEKYAREKATAQYNADLAEWNNKWIMSIVDGASAVIEAGPLTPFGIATGIAAAIQTGVILANQPKPPSFATGGIVMPSGSGSQITVAENGYPEMMINGGASGEAFLNDIANRIASVVASRQAGSMRAVININGREIEAEIMNIVEDGTSTGAMKIYDSAIVRG